MGFASAHTVYSCTRTAQPMTPLRQPSTPSPPTLPGICLVAGCGRPGGHRTTVQCQRAKPQQPRGGQWCWCYEYWVGPPRTRHVSGSFSLKVPPVVLRPDPRAVQPRGLMGMVVRSGFLAALLWSNAKADTCRSINKQPFKAIRERLLCQLAYLYTRRLKATCHTKRRVCTVRRRPLVRVTQSDDGRDPGARLHLPSDFPWLQGRAKEKGGCQRRSGSGARTNT